MGKVVEWSDLNEELVDLIAKRSSSKIDHVRIRSICKPWRSAVPANKKKKPFPDRFKRILPRFKTEKTTVLSPSPSLIAVLSPIAYFRVTLPSSCPKKGWLINKKVIFDYDSKYGKVKLSSPLSCRLITPSKRTINLLKFGVSEIRQSYNIQWFDVLFGSYWDRVVLVDNLVFAINHQKELWWCKNGEETSNLWIRIENEDVEYVFDITLHKGQIYALDLKGAVWWIKLSDRSVFQYLPSTPLKYYEIDTCKDKRLVEFCGDLCVVHRFYKTIRIKKDDIERTTGFKVLKMDKELVRWVEVDSLGDKALIVATDSCFTVLASDYYGCLENAIYFTEGQDVSVFKLDDDSIITKNIDSYSDSHQSCFQMFSAPFL